MKKLFSKKRYWLSAIIVFFGFTACVGAMTETEEAADPKQEVVEEDKAKSEEVATQTAAKSVKEEDAKEKAEEEKKKAEEEAKKKAEADAKKKAEEELDQYYTEMATHSYEFSDIMFRFSDLMGDVGDNPTLFFDDAWKIDTVVALVEMEQSMDKMRAMTPPEAAEDVHNLVLSALVDYQFLIDNFPKAIDNVDADLIQQCAVKMNEGTAKINEAGELIAKQSNS